MNYYYSLIKTEDFDRWERGEILLKFLDPQRKEIDFFTKGYLEGNLVVPYEICKPGEKDDLSISFQEFCKKVGDSMGKIDTPLSLRSNVGVVIGFVVE